MTQSIDRSTRERAVQAPVPETVTRRHRPLTIGVGCFTVVATTGGTICGVATLTGASWRIAIMGATLLMLAGLGAVVLCVQNMIADRQDFYRRGHLDGWMRGWRGQEPGGEDPTFK